MTKNDDLFTETSAICFLSGGINLKEVLGYISLILGIILTLFSIVKTIYTWIKNKEKKNEKE